MVRLQRTRHPEFSGPPRAARLVLGMGEGATLPAATRALSNWTSLASRGTAVGTSHAAGRLGAGASAPIVAFLITWFSWRFIRPTRHRVGALGGGMLVVVPRGSASTSPHHERWNAR